MKPIRATTGYSMQTGFTLAEIAIVLIIVALLSGVAFNMLTAFTSQSRLGAARDKQKALKSVLKEFIGRNGRLPCPAVEALDHTNASFGLEAPPTTGASGANACPGTVAIGTCTAQQNCLQTLSFRGIVPWRTLGIPQEAVMDPWNRFYTYQVSVSAIVSPLDDGAVVSIRSAQAMVGNIPVHSAIPVGVGNQVNTGNEAVVVLVSHGADGLGAYIPGRQMASPTGATQLENADATRAFVDADSSNIETDPYDDVVAFHSVATMLDGLTFPTPGLESMTGRVKFLAEMMVSASTAVPPCPPPISGPCMYQTPISLAAAGVPAPLQYDTTGNLIILTSGGNAITPTGLSFRMNGNDQFVSAPEFWNIGVRMGSFH